MLMAADWHCHLNSLLVVGDEEMLFIMTGKAYVKPAH